MKTTLPYVPPEGQPPAWWQDLRIQAIVVSSVVFLIKKVYHAANEEVLTSKVTETLTWVFAFGVPLVLGAIGQMKSIWRRKIQSGTLQAAVESPEGVPPALTADSAKARAPSDPQPSPLADLR